MTGAKNGVIKHIPGTIKSRGKLSTDFRYLAEPAESKCVGISSMTKSEKHWILASKNILSLLMAE